jgi:uncharacterized protein (TIGR03000 family)
MRSLLLSLALILGCAAGASAQVVIFRPGYRGAPVSPFNPAPFYNTGISPGYAGGYSPWGYNPWGYGFGYGYGGPILLPGFAADDPPRMRSSVYPAIPLPPRDIIAAKLAGEEDGRATLRLTLPSDDAQVWLDGKLMGQAGVNRRYVTPALNADKQYVMQVRVQWMDETGPQTRMRTVTLSAGATRDLTIR